MTSAISWQAGRITPSCTVHERMRISRTIRIPGWNCTHPRRARVAGDGQPGVQPRSQPVERSPVSARAVPPGRPGGSAGDGDPCRHEAVGVDDQVGTLTPGKRADIAVIRLCGDGDDPYERLLRPDSRSIATMRNRAGSAADFESNESHPGFVTADVNHALPRWSGRAVPSSRGWARVALVEMAALYGIMSQMRVRPRPSLREGACHPGQACDHALPVGQGVPPDVWAGRMWDGRSPMAPR